ncbi:MAG TPA: HU family DNA-binding protein [Pseudomonadales bacterium]
MKKAAKKKPAKKAPAKKVAKKATKKPAARKASAKKAAPAAKKAGAPVKARYSKSQIVNEIATNTDLGKKQVNDVLEELTSLIERHITSRGCGEFVLPGLLKVTTRKVPARKAKKGINPFTKEPMMIKARPASVKVTARPLKKLKEMAN